MPIIPGAINGERFKRRTWSQCPTVGPSLAVWTYTLSTGSSLGEIDLEVRNRHNQLIGRGQTDQQVNDDHHCGDEWSV